MMGCRAGGGGGKGGKQEGGSFNGARARKGRVAKAF